MTRVWLAGGANDDASVTLIKSTDDTATWDAVPNPCDGGYTQFAAAGNSRLFVGGSDSGYVVTVAYSDDSGATWTPVTPWPTIYRVYSAAYSPTLDRWGVVGLSTTVPGTTLAWSD